MKKAVVSLVSILFMAITASGAAIGSWKAYLAYSDVTEIEKAGKIIYVLASNDLYSYNTDDKSITTYDKSTTLNDCTIDHIAWCQSAKRLVIVYSNGNIDLLDANEDVTNISDYYQKSMTADKTINSIYVYNGYVYMSTGFGIVKVNVADAEISDTYNLGFNVNYSYISGNNIYAASSAKGLYSASLSDNLLDKSNWKRVGDYVEKSKTIDADLLALVKTLSPGGPKYNYFGFLRFGNNMLYSCGGGIGDNKDATIQVLNGNDWTIYQDTGISEVTGAAYKDLVCLDYDPTDANHVFAGGRTGLYEFENGKFKKFYTNDNSLLETASTVGNGNKDYVLVTGLKFDTNRNLWCLNSTAPKQSLLELTNGNTWNSYAKSDYMVYNNRSLENMVNPMFDSRGLLWFVNDYYRIPSLLYFNPKDSTSKRYGDFINQDGTTLTVNNVHAVAEDNDNNIWIGTDIGPLMLETSQLQSNGSIFTQVKVPRNDGTNYADYLLSGVEITCIAIDGGGRKWFGTNGVGAYLISKDNLTQVQHFTQSNSKLLSNVIQSVAINDKTGEVYFGTDKGLCSYMSDATATNTEMTKDNVYAYPNPVRPDYKGLITVVGLTASADVKIVTANGVLVAEGTSNGGSFTWDGNDKKGKRVASGVYMVETATSDGSKGTVCKIAVIN
jgi:hypothetical protein